MRPEQLYLSDLVQAADRIAGFLEGIQRDSFLGNELLKSAVTHQLIVIGEACSQLSRGFCSRHPEIPWRDIKDFRNLAVHAYFAVNWEIVWDTATHDLPLLRSQIAAILAATPKD